MTITAQVPDLELAASGITAQAAGPRRHRDS